MLFTLYLYYILGSPVKCEMLEIPSKVTTSLEDPRPMHLRNMAGYNDFVRNMVCVLTNYTNCKQCGK